MVFSVRKISAVVKNADDAALCKKIQDSAQINSHSIFFLDENKIISKISQAVPEVKVLKLERKFPDKLIIHTIKRSKVCYIKYDKVFYILSEDLTVIDIINTRPVNLSELIIQEDIDLSTAQKGCAITLHNTTQANLINLLDCINNIGSEYFDLIQKIIYQRKTNDFFLKTTSGVVIHISFVDRLQEKVQIAFSLYNHSPLYRAGGIISAYIDKNGQLKASFRPGEIDL